MKKHLCIACLFLPLSACSVPGQSGTRPELSAIIRSRFDTGIEGWTVSGDAQGPSALPDYQSTGGNPGGNISAVDDTVGGVWYWNAPGNFLGNRVKSYQKKLSFDLKQSSTNSQFDDEDLILEGDGVMLVYDLSANPGTGWTSYQVQLSESAGWKEGKLTGPAPSPETFKRVLGKLEKLWIRGEFVTGHDVGELDNVILEN